MWGCREQREEANSVWMGTGGFAEDLAPGGSEGPGGFIRAEGVFTQKEQQVTAQAKERGEPESP